jgi:HD-GYP domain-containing protein (c-di-GMP phosphodiesterase class II)
MDYENIANFIDELLTHKDPYNHHGAKVANLSEGIAKLMSRQFDEHELKMLHYGARMHDVGKIFVEDGILNLHGRLTKNQYAAVKIHSSQGYQLAFAVGFEVAICEIIRYHHENYNGSGYPDGLREEEIPIMARIVRLADTYDSLTSARSYREPASHQDAMAIIQTESGSSFDPQLVRLLKISLDK